MESHQLTTADRSTLHYYAWVPETPPRAVVLIAHGMGEHAARYGQLAGELNAAGYAVYAQDHRGHGRTARADAAGDMGADGWNRTIGDAYQLFEHAGSAHPGVPRVLLGHSMGSMLAQQFIYRHGHELDALVLSGSPGQASAFQMWLSHSIARFERWRHGPEQASPLMDQLLFGANNKNFDAPGATGYEWLSRDASQVQRYVDDPMCGFVLRTGSLCDLFAGAREARRKVSTRSIPTTLPIYVFSGSADPLHGEEKNLHRLLGRYREVNPNIEYRSYPEGRHEMFNELNRDEVVQDLLNWLERAVP